MMNPLYSSWNNASDYSRYPRGNTAPTVLPQMHYRYRGSTVHSVPSPRYYPEILPIPTVITAVTAVLPHSPLPCHSLTDVSSYTQPRPSFLQPVFKMLKRFATFKMFCNTVILHAVMGAAMPSHHRYIQSSSGYRASAVCKYSASFARDWQNECGRGLTS